MICYTLDVPTTIGILSVLCWSISSNKKKHSATLYFHVYVDDILLTNSNTNASQLLQKLHSSLKMRDLG